MPRKHVQSLSEKMHAKDWRALPQTVALGGDTKSSKRRRLSGALRFFSVVLLFAGIVSLFVYVWLDMTADPVSESGEARSVRLEFISEKGVLDEAWFRRWTEFDEKSAPNLNALYRRLTEYPQVRAARIRRLAGGALRVELRERTPFARLIDADGAVRLIADDGVIFPSETFPSVQSALPLLQNAKIVEDGEFGFERVVGMKPLAEFISLARANYKKLFAEWDVISLKDFPTEAAELAQPWSVLRVIPKATSRDPAQAQIAEIVFSATRFREDLALLAAADASGKLDEVLGSIGTAGTRRAVRIIFITNRKTPGREFREMRIIPFVAGTP